ncbi:MAG: fasciclin domain-containing protein [Sphingobacteriaceae bacterium]|nr:MAG: fasciclin domain-containing protein [Sphingobacteriaceae bacterium]
MKLKQLILLTFIAVFTTSSFAQTTGKNIDGVVMLPSRNAFDNLSANPNFSVFVTLVKSAGLTGTLNGQSAVTVFAPNNKAFAKLPLGLLDTLVKPENRAQLVTLINNHLLAGKINSAGIAQQIKRSSGSARFTTLAGTSLIAIIDGNRNINITDGKGNKSIVSRFNAEQKNGILHAITEVLIPAVL